MAAVTTFESRLAVELQRKYLSQPGPLPATMLADLAAYPGLVARAQWGIVRAADIVALLQPGSERDPESVERCFKIAGVRHVLLPGLIDEPWVQALVDDGTGSLSAWRDRRVEGPALIVIGHAADLILLEAPGGFAEIESAFRRGQVLGRETDWMTRSVFGFSLPQVIGWLDKLRDDNPTIFLALIRRDAVKAIQLLKLEPKHVRREAGRNIHAVAMILEIMRLVELMRAGAGPGRATSDDLIGALSTPQHTISALQNDDPLGQYIADGWMFMSTLKAFKYRQNIQLSAAFPLLAYKRSLLNQSAIGIIQAIQDPRTHEFYSGALTGEAIVAGKTRSLTKIQGKQPIEFFCGIESMRLAVVALRAIARKSRQSNSLNYTNRAIIGRLALHLLSETDPEAFDAYVQQWANTRAVKAAGLTRADLEHAVTDEYSEQDLGAGQVIRTEKIRRFVPVGPDSEFNPYWWGRDPSSATWENYHAIARNNGKADRTASALSLGLLREISKLGEAQSRYFDGDVEAVNEAAELCALIGAHHTPLSRDPALFVAALSRKNRIVPRLPREITTLKRRYTKMQLQKQNVTK